MRTALLLAGLIFATVSHAEIASEATAVTPILPGSAAPEVSLLDHQGTQTSLHQALNGKPTLLVFYRGGWCPYCNMQLSALHKLVPDLAGHGFQLIAVSPDRPEELSRTLEKTELDYLLLSDSQAELMQAFGIAFKVDDETIEKYKGYNIDLEQASGESHHALPVPSVFVIDAAGVVQFGYSNPDYRTRVPERIVRAAIEAVEAGETGKSVR